MADIMALVRLTVNSIRDTLDLAAVELELAARSLVLMIVLGLFLAAVVVLVWLLMLATLGAFFAHELALGWTLSLLLLTLINATIGGITWLVLRRLARRLGLPGLRKALGTADQAADRNTAP
ncbi:MAG: hypothetical protein ACXIUB_04020 [Wenzhouxiangella sp.]